MEQIKKFIEEKYRPEDGALTSQSSQGNCDDQFSDGEARGYAMALEEVAKRGEIKVKPLQEQQFDD